MFLKINLDNLLSFDASGLENTVKCFSNKSVLINKHIETPNYSLFLRGCFYGFKSEELLVFKLTQFIEEKDYTTKERFMEIMGEFSIVCINKLFNEVLLISDVSGSGKLFYSIEDKNILISNKLNKIPNQQSNPTFSQVGLSALFAFSYNFDPYTILSNTYCTKVGETISINSNGEIVKYDNREKLYPTEKYDSLSTSIQKTDEVLTNYFLSRSQQESKNIIYVSGGIDSLIMTHYAKKAFGENINTLNFSLSGNSNNEKKEAEIASKYYKTNHIEHIVDTKDIVSLTKEAFEECDFPQMGNFMNLATKKFLINNFDSQFINVFTGEDTRIYSPTIDLPFKIGFYLTQKKFSPEGVKKIYDLIVNNWPIKYGKNYSKYFFNKATPSLSVHLHILKTMMRFSNTEFLAPEIIDIFIKDTLKLIDSKTVEDTHYNAVDISFLLQYSDDNNDSILSPQFEMLKVHLPFYNPEVLTIAKNIPYKYIIKSKMVPPHLTRSRFWFTDKYFLRKLMDGKAPLELLYRKKATAGNPILIFDYCWDDLYKPLLLHAKEMCDNNIFKGKISILINDYVSKALTDKEFVKSSFSVSWHFHIVCWLAFFHKNYMKN